MSQENDEFDVLTFFIIVMGVLTAIVGLFAYLLHGKVKDESRQISIQLKSFKTMQDLALDEKFRDWIGRENEGKLESGKATEFTARIQQSAARYQVNYERLDPKPAITRADSVERPYSVAIRETQLEPLVKFLYDVEEKWPGSKVKTMQLTWKEKEKTWAAEVEISIFKTNTE